MKSYTDLHQSKILAEKLPLESADMLFPFGEDKYADSIKAPLTKEHWKRMMPDITPCWSVVALLGVLQGPDLAQEKVGSVLLWQCSVNDASGNLLRVTYGNNPVDACYEMVLKLHELKKL